MRTSPLFCPNSNFHSFRALLQPRSCTEDFESKAVVEEGEDRLQHRPRPSHGKHPYTLSSRRFVETMLHPQLRHSSATGYFELMNPLPIGRMRSDPTDSDRYQQSTSTESRNPTVRNPHHREHADTEFGGPRRSPTVIAQRKELHRSGEARSIRFTGGREEQEELTHLYIGEQQGATAAEPLNAAASGSSTCEHCWTDTVSDTSLCAPSTAPSTEAPLACSHENAMPNVLTASLWGRIAATFQEPDFLEDIDFCLDVVKEHRV
mmetsp:Transcript_12873/g.22973  ORF Transcript_12873/g.22973 Transcript_12873/m.22973 type:complete len:263 (+) Transcript_12873:90-878(+)